MFVNSYYDARKSIMHVWEQINGEDLHTEYPWTPYLFVPSRNDSRIKTIEGIPVEKKQFRDYYTYNEFQNNAGSNIYENKVKPEIQFLSERYHNIPDEELSVPNLTIYYLDIEVHKEDGGFPDKLLADDPITIISVRNNKTGITTSFGCKPYTEERRNVKYFYCKDEKILLKKFFLWINKNSCDVISGWNIWDFDLPYIIRRSQKLLDKDFFNLLSPVNIVRIWKQKLSEDINIDIAGVCILDYYNVYKWYSPDKLERYTLDFVSNYELGVGKLDFSEHETLTKLYHENWNMYVDYNITDCERVDQLEKKLGYIRLIQALSLLSKAPMRYYNAMTALIEGYLLTYYRRNGLCAPFFAGGTQETFEAAYVKEPQKGMFEWICDLDITSSYPSHIIALNMSNETYFGRIHGVTEDFVITCTRKREFSPFSIYKEKTGLVKIEGKKLEGFNKALQRGLLAVAPCGSVFSTNVPGIIANVERLVFAKRKKVKNKMKEVERKIENMPESKEKHKMEDRAKELFSLQWALKIWLNAVFGILAVPYSRYFNVNIAEAITSCGRRTIKQGEVFVNEYYNSKKLQTDINDWVCYSDTDSLFCRLGDYLKITQNDWDEIDDSEKINRMLNESKLLERYIDKRTFEETQLLDYNSQVHDFRIGFKQEIISKTALFIKKKKYAYWCVNKEGISTDKLSVTGLEIVRSDSAEAIRPRLRHIMEMIMKNEEEKKLRETIKKYKKELLDMKPEEIAANIGINGIEKYIKDGKSIKGTPWHVKGVANYKKLLEHLKIDNKYEDIQEGVKGKVIYVKKNQFGVDTITFYRWPIEFNEILIPDKQIMIDKFFIKKIETLLEPMGKEHILKEDIKKSMNVFFK